MSFVFSIFQLCRCVPAVRDFESFSTRRRQSSRADGGDWDDARQVPVRWEWELMKFEVWMVFLLLLDRIKISQIRQPNTKASHLPRTLEFDSDAESSRVIQAKSEIAFFFLLFLFTLSCLWKWFLNWEIMKILLNFSNNKEFSFFLFSATI